MKSLQLAPALGLCLIVASCGTHGSYNSTNTTSSGSTNNSYSFVAPKVNSQRNYLNTIVDDSNNNISQTIDETVLSVNSDGSYSVQQQDPSANSVIFNGTHYSVPTETINVNNLGQETSYSYTPSGGTLTTCSVSPHGAGPNYPVSVGDTWTSSYNISCGGGSPINYMQTGTVVAVETIQVPAGTYSTLKLQSTITWTDANGTTHSVAVTNWRDIDTSISVQENTTITYSGTPPAGGHPVTTTKVLQSVQ